MIKIALYVGPDSGVCAKVDHQSKIQERFETIFGGSTKTCTKMK